MTLCSIQNKSSSGASPQPQYVLDMVLNFGHFSVSCSYKKGSYKKKNVFV